LRNDLVFSKDPELFESKEACEEAVKSKTLKYKDVGILISRSEAKTVFFVATYVESLTRADFATLRFTEIGLVPL